MDLSHPNHLSAGGKRSSRALDPDLDDEGSCDDRILGGGEFAARVLDLAGHASTGPAMSLAELIDRVATYFDLDQSRLTQPGKEWTLVRARAVACYVAVRKLKIKGVDVAKTLGCTPGGVAHAAKNGEAFFRQEKELPGLLGIDL